MISSRRGPGPSDRRLRQHTLLVTFRDDSWGVNIEISLVSCHGDDGTQLQIMLIDEDLIALTTRILFSDRQATMVSSESRKLIRALELTVIQDISRRHNGSGNN